MMNNISNLPRVLFVDDEENILKAVSRVTVAENYQVMTVASPKKALTLIEQAVAEGLPYAVVVSDYQMPEMPGTHFLEKVRYLSPDTVRMLLTGYSDVRAAIESINRGAVYRYMEKPWNDEILRATLKDAIGQFFKGLQSRQLEEVTRRYQQELGSLGMINGRLQAAAGIADMQISIFNRKPPALSPWQKQETNTPVSIPLEKKPGATREEVARYNRLTPREKDLLYCIVQGYANKQIADELSISITTVKNHMGNIFRKLEVTNRTQAALLATQVLSQNSGSPELSNQSA